MTRLHLTRPGSVSILLSAVAITGTALAGGLGFSDPALLPGDAASGAAAGHQMLATIARGEGQSLAVWNDFRASPDNFPPFATEGSGADIFGARIDAAGNVIDTMPIIINDDFGDQVDPQAEWNGTHWLVVWKTEKVALPTYERLMAARVAADGTVLDDPPIELLNTDSYFNEWRIASNGSDWVIVYQGDAPEYGLHAIRVAADGTLPDPNPTTIHSTLFMMDIDIAYATNEYLIAWSGSFDPPRGRRYRPDLSPLDPAPFALPGMERIASDGTDFLSIWNVEIVQNTVYGAIVNHDGSVNPQFTIAGPFGQGACCVKAAFDGTNYWAGWGNSVLARVSPAGVVLDPEGFSIGDDPLGYNVPTEFDGAPGGGVQVVWNTGSSGAIYPKDIFTTKATDPGPVANESLLSRGALAQVDADFAAGDGQFAIAFESRVSEITSIKVQRLDALGGALDPEPLVVASGPDVGFPGIAFDGTRYMITWSDGFQVFGRRMLSNGTFLDATPLTIMDGHEPDVAAVGSVFLVVALDFINGNAQWQSVYSMRVDGATGTNLDAASVLVGGDFVIFARHPHVVSWGDRWLAVSQFNLSHDNTIAGTGGAIIDADGTSAGWIGIPIGWRPDVAVSGDRALFVAVSQTIASAHADIEAQVMLADGTLLGNWFTISDAPDKQLAPEVVFDGENFIVAWEDKRNSVIHFDERTDIYGTRIAPDGTILDFESPGVGGVPLAATEVSEIDAAMVSAGGTTLLAASVFTPGQGLCAYRIGIGYDEPFVLAGDANRDGRVDVDDIVMIVTNWGPCPAPPAACDADVDGNGQMDVDDIVMVILNWS